jgi:hypothetical protein
MNRCNVKTSRPFCDGIECDHFVPYTFDGSLDCCYRTLSGYCVSLSAIRAAIEAEKESTNDTE